MQAGGGWRAHISEPQPQRAQRSRASHRERTQPAASRPLANAAARRCRWVPLLLALVVVCRPHLASPLEHDEPQGTGQVWDVAGGRGVANRYPKSDIREIVRISQNLATYGWTVPENCVFDDRSSTGAERGPAGRLSPVVPAAAVASAASTALRSNGRHRLLPLLLCHELFYNDWLERYSRNETL